MPVNDVSIHIEAEDRSQQAFRQVDQSLKSLEQQTRAVQSSTRQSAAALGLFDDEAKKAAIGVTALSSSFQRTGRRATELDRGFTRASGGANILTRSVGSLGGVRWS